MTAAIIPMRWAKNRTHDDKLRCACCDKIINGNHCLVEVIDGGSSVAAPGLRPDESDAGYMGFFPVGNSCAKKHFNGFTIKGE
jgi:hypothetical protein